jgi:hypothetical protein
MMEMSDLASSLEDSMSSLKDGLLLDQQRHVVVKGRDAGDERPGLESRSCGVWPQGRDPHGSLLPAARGGEQWPPHPHQSPAGTLKVDPGSQFSVLGISYFYLLLLFSFLLQCSSIPSFFWYGIVFFFFFV